MKKLLAIMVLSLLLSGYAYAELITLTKCYITDLKETDELRFHKFNFYVSIMDFYFQKTKNSKIKNECPHCVAGSGKPAGHRGRHKLNVSYKK